MPGKKRKHTAEKCLLDAEIKLIALMYIIESLANYKQYEEVHNSITVNFKIENLKNFLIKILTKSPTEAIEKKHLKKIQNELSIFITQLRTNNPTRPVLMEILKNNNNEIRFGNFHFRKQTIRHLIDLAKKQSAPLLDKDDDIKRLLQTKLSEYEATLPVHAENIAQPNTCNGAKNIDIDTENEDEADVLLRRSSYDEEPEDAGPSSSASAAKRPKLAESELKDKGKEKENQNGDTTIQIEPDLQEKLENVVATTHAMLKNAQQAQDLDFALQYICFINEYLAKIQTRLVNAPESFFNLIKNFLDAATCANSINTDCISQKVIEYYEYAFKDLESVLTIKMNLKKEKICEEISSKKINLKPEYVDICKNPYFVRNSDGFRNIFFFKNAESTVSSSQTSHNQPESTSSSHVLT